MPAGISIQTEEKAYIMPNRPKESKNTSIGQPTSKIAQKSSQPVFGIGIGGKTAANHNQSGDQRQPVPRDGI